MPAAAAPPLPEKRPSAILPLVGFLAVAGSFAAGLVMTYQHDAPVVVIHEELPPPEDLMEVYYPFPDQIFITMPDGAMVIATVSFYLKSAPAALLHLQDQAKTRQPELKAALLDEAQLAAETADTLDAYRAGLAGRLAARMNGLLGSDEDPEPIKEVLLTSFVAR